MVTKSFFIYLSIMKRGITQIFIAIVVSFVSVSCADNFYGEIAKELNEILSQRELYFKRQRELIEIEEQRLLQSHNLREQFDICYRLFNLSRSYKYDIAYKYASELIMLAETIGDADLIARAKGCQISTFTSGGIFSEAAEVVGTVDVSGVSDEVKRELYYNIVRFYSDNIDYVNDQKYKAEYTTELRQYADSIITLSPTKDFYYAYAKCYKELSDENYAQVAEDLSGFYGTTALSAHHNSIITFLLGYAYFELGDRQSGFDYMTLAVGYDVEAAARENRSIKTISEELFTAGQTKIAERLIEIAYEDANFYNARHRNLEVNSLLPIINKHKITTISRQRNILYSLLAVISVLSVVAVVFGVIARRNAKIAKASKRTIQEQMARLSQINSQLNESNKIKEHYIIDSIYKSNEHLKQNEALLKKIDTKVKNRLYDDLHNIYKEFNIKRDKASFFVDFDRAFLNLFPNFIEEYNTLFRVEDQIDIETSSELPTEVRIFALMRLGITDAERISRFLDISVNTIYTYKTKVKSRSIIAKEKFESRILNIKLSPDIS